LLKIVVQDTPPHTEEWTISVPPEVQKAAKDHKAALRWYLRVDAEGNLTVTMEIVGAKEELRYEGAVRRERNTGAHGGPDYLWGSLRDDVGKASDDAQSHLISITPLQWNDLAKAAQELRSWQKPKSRS
jgi:hypothetical protein